MNGDFEKRVVAHRRALHERAEVGFELKETREYIVNVLNEQGYSPKIIGKGSILASTQETSEKYVLLRADMDALEIREETALPFASTNGAMHACGHDMHSAMLLGAAELLAKKRPSIGVLLLFQASEEKLEGAADVIRSGLFEEHEILCAFTVHVLANAPVKSGTVILPPEGVVAPGADVIKIKVRGASAHGSTPHLGKNSIYPVMDIIDAIDSMLQREIAPTKLRVLNWGKINGGAAANIVPEITEIEGNFRYYDEDLRSHVLARCKEICNYVAKAYAVQAKYELVGGCPPLQNDGKLLMKIRDGIGRELGDVIDSTALKTDNEKAELAGSEDFAHFSRRVPSLLFPICAGRAEDGYGESLHTPKTDFDERALVNGARLLASLPFLI